MGFEAYVIGVSQNDLLHSINCGDGEPFFVENTIGGKRIWCKKAAEPSTYLDGDHTRAIIKDAVYNAKVALVHGAPREKVFNELERLLLALVSEAQR